MNVFHQLRGVLSPARRPTRPLAHDARRASAPPEATRPTGAARRRSGAIPTPFSLWVVRIGLALAVFTLLAPLPVTLSVIQAVVSPVRWSLVTLILMVGSAALAATVAAVLIVRANAPDARANVTFIALGGMCLFALLCWAGLLVPATRTDALLAGMVGFAVLSTGAVVWSPWFGGTWGAILACLLIWGNVICFPLTLPSATLTTYALAGLLTASLITILLAREQTKRTAWARSSTQIIGNLGLSATQVTAMLLLLLVGWVVAIPLLTTAQWRPATHALAAARERLSQVNPLTTPGARGPAVAAFGVIKSAPTSSTAAAQAGAPIVIRYHITTAPKGQPLAPRLDVVALDAVDANNIWSVGPAPTVDLAANVTLTTTAVVGNLTVGRITVLNAIPGNYVPAFESAVRLSIPLQAQTLEAATTLTATHGQSIVDTENLQLIGTTAPTLPLAYVVTSTAIVYTGTPAPFSAPTLTYLTAIPPTLRAPLHQTAQAFASGATDPSDPRAIASAIETAMRQQWTLTTSPQHSLQPTPTGDAAVLSLLTTHRGDAYAWDTTYALLLRAEGIPTRLMEGYLPGTYDRVMGDQVISAANESYWPQAALDDSGWATLDPIAHLQPVSASGANSGGTTPGGHPKAAKTPTSGGTSGSGSAQHAPATATPTRSASAQTPPPPPLVPPAVVHRVGLSGAWLLLLAVVLLLSGAALLLWRAWLRRTATHPRRVVRPIRRLVGLARVLGVPGVGRAKTSAQALRAITRAVAGPDTMADQLTTIYTTAVYAPPSVHLDAKDVELVARNAARLGRALVFTRLTRTRNRSRPAATTPVLTTTSTITPT